MPTTRSHDLVLFGATGFTGGMTARYLAGNAPAGLRWALAGRDHAKLVRRRAELTEVDPACADLPLLLADASDAESLRAVAEDTRVVITTVGPYLRYGEPLVAACSEAGTDYVDLTGEPPFVDRMYVGYHQRAMDTGARLVHSCGFESVPLDLGVLHTVRQLPEDVPIHIEGYVTADTGLSGGSIQTTLTAMTRPLEIARAERARREVERLPADRAVVSAVGSPIRVPALDSWAMPMPTISRFTVGRSAWALPRYGPDFHYEHRFLKHPLVAVGGAVGLLALS
ncbi:MAG TPA: saccharopine dehydrogenase NADP-binding domain-containing protein, partial [Micromonosporaceae bacterium]